MITEEALKQWEELRSKATGGEWQHVVGRGEPHVRVDIYSGPKINKEEISKLQEQFSEIAKKLGRNVMKASPTDGVIQFLHKAVTHSHLVQPAWFEQNENSLNDVEYICKSHNEMIPQLIAEVRRLKQIVGEK